jgi:hypothetical protein
VVKRRRTIEAVVARIEAIALEYPIARWARVFSGFASQIGDLGRRLSYRPRYRRIAWPRLLDALRSALLHRYLWILAATAGVVLTAPVVGRGWGMTDDVLQRQTMLSSTLSEAFSAQFEFLHPAKNAELMDLGAIPWWTLEGVRVAFFRPLSTLTHWLDYQLWPNSDALMHAHNILWYGGLCALVVGFYRRFLGRTPIAGLAALLFTGSVAHLSGLGSIAGRNVLIVAVFGLLTLMLHDWWRRDGRRVGAFLAPISLLLALLSAEGGAATLAYLAAYAVFLDRTARSRRLATLAPYGAVVVMWRLVYQHLGYGAWGSGFYIDPGREPLRFAVAILENGPILLFGKWFLLEPGLYAGVSGWASALFWLIAVLSVAFVGVVLRPLFQRDRVARFLALGMMLAVIPSCAVSLPSTRLLVFIEFGTFGLMALFIAGLLGRSESLSPRRVWKTTARALCFVLLGIHAVLSPLLLPIAHTAHDFIASVVELGSLPEGERQDVVVVNAPSPGQLIYLRSVREERGQPVPTHLRVLAPGYASVVVTRVDERTLVVRPEYGYVAPAGVQALGSQDPLHPIHPAYGYRHGDALFRGNAYRAKVGQRVELTGMSAEVAALTNDGRPAEAFIQFNVPLEDRSLHWLQWDWHKEAYVPFPLPAMGETAYVPGPF